MMPTHDPIHKTSSLTLIRLATPPSTNASPSSNSSLPPPPPIAKKGKSFRSRIPRLRRSFAKNTNNIPIAPNNENSNHFITNLFAPFQSFKQNLITKAEKAAKKNKNNESSGISAGKKVFLLLLYMSFLLAYSLTAIHVRHDDRLSPLSIYDMQNMLTKLFTLQPANSKSEPIYKSSGASDIPKIPLHEVSTVRDFYTYLRTTFSIAAYSSSTFDGGEYQDWVSNPSSTTGTGGRKGFVLGHQMVMGGIRISQFRTDSFSCGGRAPGKLFEGYNRDGDEEGVDSRFVCYGASGDGGQSTETYSTASFKCTDPNFDWSSPPLTCSGQGPTFGGYVYSPMSSEITQATVLDKVGFDVAPPGFNVVLPNQDEEEARNMFATMYTSNFVDLQTRSVFIDISFWNFNIERLITMKIMFDLPLSGGVIPSFDVKVADLYTCNIASFADISLCETNDIVRMAFEFVCFALITSVALISTLNFWYQVMKILMWNYKDDEVTDDGGDGEKNENVWWNKSFAHGHVYKKKKSRTLKKLLKKVIASKPISWWFWNTYLYFQLFVYYGYFLCRYVTFESIPTNVDVASDEYIDFHTPAIWANYSDRLNAFFIFLSWLRLIEFISFFSGQGLLLFSGMFVVFISGSALSNQIAFGYYLKNYSTFSNSFFTTLRALRGDIPDNADISSMMNSGLLGLLFGVSYFVILVYILLHLLLAIFFALAHYMKNLYKDDPIMSMVLGITGNDDSGSDSDNDINDEGDDHFKKMPKGMGSGHGNTLASIAQQFLSQSSANANDGKKNHRGKMKGEKNDSNSKHSNSNNEDSYLSKIENLMGTEGLFGISQRALNISPEDEDEDSTLTSYERDKAIKAHTDIVMKQVHIFCDMAMIVGCTIFDINEDTATSAITRLLKDVNVMTGQINLDVVVGFFEEIGLNLGGSGRETLHALFGRSKDNLLRKRASNRTHSLSHTGLTSVGLSIKTPYVNLDSLALVLLSALPLKSTNKALRDYIPKLTAMPVINDLARDLIQHVAVMLHNHSTEFECNTRYRGLPVNVVDGLDLIFNMISASIETILPLQWRDTSIALINRIKSGLHSLASHPNPEVQLAIEEYTEELQKTLRNNHTTKLDVVHQTAKFKRKISTIGGGSEMVLALHSSESFRGLSITPDPTTVALTHRSLWGDLMSGIGIGNGNGDASPKPGADGGGSKVSYYDKSTKIKGDKQLAEVDDFLISVMEEAGAGRGSYGGYQDQYDSDDTEENEEQGERGTYEDAENGFREIGDNIVSFFEQKL